MLFLANLLGALAILNYELVTATVKVHSGFGKNYLTGTVPEWFRFRYRFRSFTPTKEILAMLKIPGVTMPLGSRWFKIFYLPRGLQIRCLVKHFFFGKWEKFLSFEICDFYALSFFLHKYSKRWGNFCANTMSFRTTTFYLRNTYYSDWRDFWIVSFVINRFVLI